MSWQASRPKPAPGSINWRKRTCHTLTIAKRVVQELEDKCDELARCVDFLHAAERKAEDKQNEANDLRGKILASRWFKLGRKLNLGPVVDPRK